MSRRAMGKQVERLSELPAELTQARRFGKARSAQSTALLEDDVELIADLLANAGEARPTDIAGALGFPMPPRQNHLSAEAGRDGNGPSLSWRFSDEERAGASGASTNPP